MMVAPRNMWDDSVSPRIAIVDAQFKMCMHNYHHAAPPMPEQSRGATGEVRSGMLGGVRGAVRIVSADQVLIVPVDGVDERRLIVERDCGHNVVVDVNAAGQQWFVVADEQHPRQHGL